MKSIDLNSPLTLRNAFMFPLQSGLAQKEVLIGAALLLVPLFGWLMNMGHRILIVHQMMNGNEPWPAWRGNWTSSLRHGAITFFGMMYYYLPGLLLGYLGYRLDLLLLIIVGGVCLSLATIAIPGYMSHYCQTFNTREIFNPFVALRRSFEIGTPYWHAWVIALSALLLSFAGLLALGIGFLFTSVWFWQVAGFGFACAFTQSYQLDQAAKITNP